MFKPPHCELRKRRSLPSFLWQCRSYFPPSLPLECLSMVSPDPSMEATKCRAGTTSRDTHTHARTQSHSHTHILSEMLPDRPQTCHHPAPLSGTSIASVSPKPLSSTTPHRSSLRARPSQAPPALSSCVQTNSYPTTQAQPCTRTIHCHLPSSLSATIPPTVRLRADGGSGLTAGPSPSSLPRPSARPSPRKAGRSGGLRLPSLPS